MKIINLILILCFVPCLFCHLRKKKSLLNLASVEQFEDSKIYGKILFDELNKYRSIHFFQDKIEWNDAMADKAESEAQKIVENQNFGDHDKFDDYENATTNDYFTEIAVRIQFPENQMPTKRIFAQQVLSTLKQQYKLYLVQDYNSGGIGVAPNTYGNDFIVVLHLVQDPHRHSCKKALDKGKKVNTVRINVKGVTETLKCDQTTEGGGWTLIADVDESSRGNALIIPIDDRGLDYKQVLFEAKTDFYLNYNFGTVNVWDFDGYNFRFNCLRFGEYWYVDRSHDGYAVKYHVFDRAQDTVVLTPATKCFFGGAQQLYNCAKKFWFKAVPQERLNAFSELQSVANSDLHNNIYRFNFKLWVR